MIFHPKVQFSPISSLKWKIKKCVCGTHFERLKNVSNRQVSWLFILEDRLAKVERSFPVLYTTLVYNRSHEGYSFVWMFNNAMRYNFIFEVKWLFTVCTSQFHSIGNIKKLSIRIRDYFPPCLTASVSQYARSLDTQFEVTLAEKSLYSFELLWISSKLFYYIYQSLYIWINQRKLMWLLNEKPNISKRLKRQCQPVVVLHIFQL